MNLAEEALCFESGPFSSIRPELIDGGTIKKSLHVQGWCVGGWHEVERDGLHGEWPSGSGIMTGRGDGAGNARGGSEEGSLP